MLFEKIPLFVGDGEAEFFHDGEHVLPNFAFFGVGFFVVEEIGGVVGGTKGDSLVILPRAAQATN